MNLPVDQEEGFASVSRDSNLFLDAFPRDLPRAAPGMADRRQAGFDLLFGEVAAPFAFRQAGQRQGEREQIEKLPVTPLGIGRGGT